MRVVTGGISHETSTFTTVETDWQSYKERFYLRGEEMLDIFRGTNTQSAALLMVQKPMDLN